MINWPSVSGPAPSTKRYAPWLPGLVELPAEHQRAASCTPPAQHTHTHACACAPGIPRPHCKPYAHLLRPAVALLVCGVLLPVPRRPLAGLHVNIKVLLLALPPLPLSLLLAAALHIGLLGRLLLIAAPLALPLPLPLLLLLRVGARRGLRLLLLLPLLLLPLLGLLLQQLLLKVLRRRRREAWGPGWFGTGRQPGQLRRRLRCKRVLQPPLIV